MVLLLNYLPALVLIAALLLVLRFGYTKNWKGALVVCVLTIFVMLALQALNPSYLPKRAVIPESLPEFEESEAVIEDRLRGPAPDHEEVLEEDLDWKERVEQEKQEAESN